MKATLKTLLVLSMLVIASLSSCDFSFLGGVDSGDEECALIETVEPFAGGERHLWKEADGTLVHYEDHFIDSGRTTQLQRYAADGTFRYGYLYQYDGSGNKILVAYYDASSALRWYQAFWFNPENLVVSSAEFDAADAVQWSRRYEYGTAALSEKLIKSARFDAAGLIDGGALYAYDASARPELVTAYGESDVFSSRALDAAAGIAASASATAVTAPRSLSSSRGQSRDLAAPAKLTFAAPAFPASFTIPAMPSDAALTALGVSGYGYTYYDAHGSTYAELTADWYPVMVTRTDDRLDRTVTVEVDWDDANRIVGKKSWYGSTLALDVDLSYNASGYPETLTTTGAAMLLPLEYGLTYLNGVPTRLDVSSGGALLQYFTYVYSGPESFTLPANAEELRAIDPFALMEYFADAQVKINHYDGDDRLIETFTFSRDGSSLRLDVKDGDGDLNGYYLATYDGEGLVATLSSHDAAGALVWDYSYGYAEAQQLASLIHEQVPELNNLASMYDIDEVASYAEAFVMDLLF